MIRQNLIEAAVPSPDRILDLIVHIENHRKIVWTAGRILKEAARWRQVEELDYEERKIVLKQVTGILEEFALQGHLRRRNEPQSIGYGNEIGFDYVSLKSRVMSEMWSPLSRPRFDEILEQEVASLPPDARKVYDDNAIGVVEQPCYRGEQHGIEHVFVIARAGSRLLLFDDVEDEFAIGVPDADGVLRDWGLFGELVFALRNLSPDGLSGS
jgi:hypothetical protein